MYPLVYHLRVDEYLPNEDFEPERFRHVREWQRANRRPSLVRRLGSRIVRAVRDVRGRVMQAPTVSMPRRCPGDPVFRWP